MNCGCKQPLDCCQDCDDKATPSPVLPRCDIALTDGRFSNATVVVEGGCITTVENGRVPQFNPDICCDGAAPVPTGNSEPCDCPPGDPGQNATITIGEVKSVAPDAPLTITNAGTQTNAILNFEIPRGAQGSSGASVSGVDNNEGGWQIKKGSITGLPLTWPPPSVIHTQATPSNVQFTASAVDNTGQMTLTLTLDDFQSQIQQSITTATDAVRNELNDRIVELERKVQTLESRSSTL